MKKLGSFFKKAACTFALVSISTSAQPVLAEESADSSAHTSGSHEPNQNGKEMPLQSSPAPNNFPQPAKTLVESYVDRRQKNRLPKNPKAKYRPGAENPFQPRPRIPENCTGEVRQNYLNCQEQKKKTVHQDPTELKKCLRYKKWFLTRCKKAHLISN